MRNRPHYRPRRPRQTSPFLRLPAEIRNQIYYLALTSPNPLDLYPPALLWEPHLANPPDPILQQRFSKVLTSLPSRTRTPLAGPPNNNPPSLAFRPQQDLLHIRKSLSTGLLCTCVQIYNEAADYFWRDNIWRFSADPNWEGIYRFLLTIGPRARSRIRRLDLMAPFALVNCEIVLLDARIKNEPKMRMQKLWLDEGPVERMCRDLVFTLLAEEKALECLNLIVPAQYKVTDLCERDCYEPGSVPDDFPAIVRVVIEAGAVVDETSLDFMQGEGWESRCLAGSEIHSQLPDETTVARQVAAGNCEKRLPRDDYLSGFSLLFAQAEEEAEEVSVAANGGKVNVPANNHGVRLARKLDAFGPCMIITRPGWACACAYWNGGCSRTELCRRVVYESMVDERDRLHERMLREWWAEVGFQEDDGV